VGIGAGVPHIANESWELDRGCDCALVVEGCGPQRCGPPEGGDLRGVDLPEVCGPHCLFCIP
jgi:hypothetical protein